MADCAATWASDTGGSSSGEGSNAFVIGHSVVWTQKPHGQRKRRELHHPLSGAHTQCAQIRRRCDGPRNHVGAKAAGTVTWALLFYGQCMPRVGPCLE